MPRKPARRTYAETVGEIMIEWNYLEREMRQLGYHYLQYEEEVASWMLTNIGNVTLTDLLVILVEKFEPDPVARDCVKHFVRAFQTLRENRNIVQHAIPEITPDEKYSGAILKVSRRNGRLVPFEAPIDLLKEVLSALREYRAFSRTLRVITHIQKVDNTPGHKGGPTMAEAATSVLASLDKPPLPRKIDPLQPQEVPKGD